MTSQPLRMRRVAAHGMRVRGRRWVVLAGTTTATRRLMIPLAISFRDMSPSAGLETLVRDCTDKLGLVYDHIERCEVVIERPHRRHHRGQRVRVRVHVAIPGPDIEVSGVHDLDPSNENAYVAVRDAFRAARRQLDDRRARRTSARQRWERAS